MTARRALRYVFFTFLAVVLVAALVVRHYAQPEKIAAALVAETRERLGLELAFTGSPRYAFWPKLRLELDGAQLRRPGGSGPLLTAEQVGVVLPWASLTDSTLAIDTLRLAAPVLDLDEANAWLAAAPAGPTPEVQAGIVIANGHIRRGGKPFISDLALDGALDLPALAAWWQALAAHGDAATPLPPLPAHATIGRIEIGGAKLEGVTIDTEGTP
jgi:hypothetical protein